MKIKIIQKIVPSYRQTFFSKLHLHYGHDFQVYTSFNKGHGPLMESVKKNILGYLRLEMFMKYLAYHGSQEYLD